MGSSSQVERNCSQCEVTINERRTYCTNCKAMLIEACAASDKFGLYCNHFRHRKRCNYSAAELEQERQQLKEDRQNERMAELQMLYDGKQHLLFDLHLNFYF